MAVRILCEILSTFSLKSLFLVHFIVRDSLKDESSLKLIMAMTSNLLRHSTKFYVCLIRVIADV